LMLVCVLGAKFCICILFFLLSVFFNDGDDMTRPVMIGYIYVLFIICNIHPFYIIYFIAIHPLFYAS